MAIFVLMAGGTGGHLFPAMALAQELRRRGHVIHLMTDHRVESYGGHFPAKAVHVVPSATPSIRNPIKLTAATAKIGYGVGEAARLLLQIKPAAVVGFGGYPVFPPFLAAALLRQPGVLHEQNAVMGRANRALARFAKAIALSFPDTRYAEPYAGKTVVTGNPVRDRVRELAGSVAYAPPDAKGPLRLLVFGGSQGARAFADFVPAAIGQMPLTLRKRLVVTQQCRPEDLERVAAEYRRLKVNCELQSFFEDMPERLVQSHLVICRSGASSVAELGVLGCPAILVPLPGALDADQSANAKVFVDRGAGWLMEQATVSPQSLGTRLTELLGAPEILARASEEAKRLGEPQAVLRLADLAERVARGEGPK